MRRRRNPTGVGELVVRYAAEEMPTATIVELQHQTVTDVSAGEISEADALRVINLLLTIALQKLDVTAALT